MRERHETILAAVARERERLATRRGVLVGGAKVAGAGAAGLALAAAPGRAFAQDDATPGAGDEVPEATGATPDLEVERDFEDDIDVLNYALTLEHLENAFYRDGLAGFAEGDLGQDPFGNSIADFLAEIGAHEQAHVDTITQVITDLGGEPVGEATYDFGDAFADPAAFLATAQALENTGVSAYDGAGAAISDPELLTAAGTIVAVEALHASYLNVINGDDPAPQPFEEPLSRDEVLEIAGPFIVGDAATPAA